jgi:rhodanese-related sulfurtransferase
MNNKKLKKQIKKNIRSPRDFIFGTVVVVGIITLGILLFFFVARSRSAASATIPEEITVSDAFERYQTGSLVIDVREKSEWMEYHVPNTTHIPLGELEKELKKISADQEIIVVCRSGNRSQTGRDILINAGFKHVTSMQGGLKSWKAAGYPIAGGD